MYSHQQAQELGKFIAAKREKSGLKPNETARRGCISVSYLYIIQSGRHSSKEGSGIVRPSYNVLKRLDGVLDLGPEAYILAGYTPPSGSINSVSSKENGWNELFEAYTYDARCVFQRSAEGIKGQMLEDIAAMLKRYS